MSTGADPILRAKSEAGSSLDEMALVECIDEGLGVLGKDDNRKIYWRLMLVEKMKENGSASKGILRDPDSFHKAIGDTFGIGAWAIERAISREIKSRFELEEIETGNLVLMIKMAMKKIQDIQDDDD